MRINKIIFFTRPWEVRFHISLARELSTILGVEVQFATFFSYAEEVVKNTTNYKIYYLPKMLGEVNLDQFDELHLKELDKNLSETLGANYNLMVGAERFLPKDPKCADVFCKKHLLVLDSIISSNSLTITSMIDHYVYWLASGLAQLKGGGQMSFCTIGMPPNYTVMYKSPFQLWTRAISKEESDRILMESIEKLGIPTRKRVAYTSANKRPNMLVRFAHTCKMIKNEERDRYYHSYFQSLHPISSRLWGHFLELIKLFSPHKKLKYDINSINDINEKYIFYPLHFEPESVILMLSPWFRNQLEITRLVAQALPVGVKLLVKDHPQMYAIRNKSYYDELKSIPNVKLCSPVLEGSSLLKNAIGTVSISGTATLESAILNKHSLCFGRPPFHNCLEYSDMARNGALGNLNSIFCRWMVEEAKPIDKDAWRDWLSHLFDITLVPNNYGVDYEIRCTESEIQKLAYIIKDCISNS